MLPKRVFHFVALLNVCFAFSCKSPDVIPPATFANQVGTLNVVVCSRGCEQYVLRTNDSDATPFYVINMPDSLKIRVVQSAYSNYQMPVVFSGTRLDEMAQVSTSGPDDGSIPIYKAYKLQLTAIRRR